MWGDLAVLEHVKYDIVQQQCDMCVTNWYTDMITHGWDTIKQANIARKFIVLHRMFVTIQRHCIK